MKRILLSLLLIAICFTQLQLNAATAPTQADINNFVMAALKGDTSTVDQLYKNNPNIINGKYVGNKSTDKSMTGYTALFFAATQERVDMVKNLLSKGANPNIISPEGYSVLAQMGTIL